jgi:predicted DNA-binding protein (MmcQ/YjbR family)
MIADDDPYLERLRRMCLSLPGAAEKISHGRPCFYTAKVFAIYGGVAKGDHHSGRYDCAVLIKPDPSEATALLSDSRFFEPAHWGPSGWLGLDFTAADVDWEEVSELVEDSFRQTAPKRRVQELQARP